MNTSRLLNPRSFRLRADQLKWLRDRAERTDHKQDSIILRRIIDQAMKRTTRPN